jgi:hypothetical protein
MRLGTLNQTCITTRFVTCSGNIKGCVYGHYSVPAVHPTNQMCYVAMDS